MPNDKVGEIVKLAQAIIEHPDNFDYYKQWTEAISTSDISTLNEVVARLTSNSTYTPANIKALREAVISTINYKNSERIIQTMRHLDQSANKLSYASFLLGIAGIILAIIQVLQAAGVIPHR